jgi:hypothetical protein
MGRRLRNGKTAMGSRTCEGLLISSEVATKRGNADIATGFVSLTRSIAPLPCAAKSSANALRKSPGAY